MKLIFENWRRYRLNEMFNSPVPDDEINKVTDDEWKSEWSFYVDERPYDMKIEEYTHDSLNPYLREWDVEFSQAGSYWPTNYGVVQGTIVMSTVLKILVDWIEENSNNFFQINSMANEPNRARLYDRLLKTITKKLGSDYMAEPSGEGGGGLQIMVNLGLLERRVDKFIEDSDFESARKIIADALTTLNADGIKRGKTVRRIVKIFDKVEEAQLGPAKTKTDVLKRRRAAYNTSRSKEQ